MAMDHRPYRLMQLLDEQRKRNAELTQSNEELRSFAHSVAHDLRTPLRGIEGFSKVLLEECGSDLNANGVKYLGFIRDSALRASKIIEDLMRLSEISRSAIHYEEVDLCDVARDVFTDCQRREPDRNVEVAVQGSFPISCDVEFMRIALENLIGNAWKFTKFRPVARISFQADGITDADGHLNEVSFTLSDNGAGFAMEDVDKLFSPFQRLHSESDFQGFGVGLATVKRVIQKHGGRVWAHSDEGRGATFGFALPV